MSFTENDRKLQSKSGKSFPIGDGQTAPSFTQTVASALKSEFGAGPSTLKAVARITGANERTVRNWFEGKNGPSGENLIILIQYSDTILKSILGLAGRRELVVMASFAGLRRQLIDAVAAIDALE